MPTFQTPAIVMSARKRNHPSPGAASDRAGKIAPGRLLAVRTLLFVAFACSVYLAYLSVTGGTAVGCGPDSGCDKVLASRWAYWFGIPVSVFALAVDATFLFATFRLGRTIPAGVQRHAWTLVVPCAILVAGAAVWFIALQLLVLGSICPYCMTAHGCGLVAALLALQATPIRPLPVKPWELESLVFITPATRRKIAIGAALGLAVLVIGQVVHQPKTFVVQQIPAGPANPANPLTQASNPIAGAPANTVPATTTTAIPTTPATALTSPTTPTTPAPTTTTTPGLAPTAPAGQRLFPIYNGRFAIDLMDVPTLGAPTNAQVVVALHDFTCHHCRAMHPLLVEAQQSFSNQLVIVTLPMPFDPNCNPLMQRANPKHTNACDYAKLSLAVWRAERTKHHAYDDYLFTGETVPPLADARQAAVQLIGADALEKALADPSVEQHLRLGIGIYETAYRAGQGSMPQFIIGNKVAVGTLPMATLMEQLAENLGLTLPPSTATPPANPANPPAP